MATHLRVAPAVYRIECLVVDWVRKGFELRAYGPEPRSRQGLKHWREVPAVALVAYQDERVVGLEESVGAREGLAVWRVVPLYGLKFDICRAYIQCISGWVQPLLVPYAARLVVIRACGCQSI